MPDLTKLFQASYHHYYDDTKTTTTTSLQLELMVCLFFIVNEMVIFPFTLLMTIFNLILTTQSTSTIILVIHQHAPAFSYRIRSITSRSKATSLWEATLVIPNCHGPLPLQMIRTSLFSAITESDEVLLLFSQDLIKQLKNKGSS